ncbi:T9SS type A sorting domain-containing protein [Rufibacter psychrotolerans]|uniref:T9SS type A sorting domain-containing protein n=1 Tax=Rufibacter psychrotolerans TaxID=2812556 RepID=UPI001967CEC1|nr:T9SS type A sorting domain-containing protein [Rufibacter sp. SYSU D00308]
MVTSDATYYLGIGITSIADGVNVNVDEVSITPINQFYNKPGADLTLLASWGDQPNGEGIQPMSFDYPDHTFHVVNSASGGVQNGTGSSLSPVTLLEKWYVSGVNSKVVLGDGVRPIRMVLAGGHSLDGAIDVQDSATLVINSMLLPRFGQMGVGSTVVFEKSVPEQLSGIEFGKVVFNTAKKNKFANKVKIKGKLTLQDARLELGDRDLELDYGATIENGSANNYVVANGKGRVRKGVKAGEEVFLPLGSLKKDGKTTTYNPVKIKLAPGSASDVFSVGVLEGVYGAYTNDVPDTTKVLKKNGVNRTWLVSEDVKGGSNVTLTFTWTAADVLPGFNPKNCHIKHYENGYWDEHPGTVATQTTVALGDSSTVTYYSVSRSGITSFTPWEVASSTFMEQGGDPTPLPVELVEFTARAGKQGGVELGWATASEQDNAFFAVERSRDGKTFAEVGRVRGGGTTAVRQAYRFTDAAPLAGVSYYRLRQVDFDGGQEYSAVRAVRLAAGQAVGLSLRPNPSRGQGVAVQVQGPAAEVLVYDLAGRQVLRRPVGGQGQALLEAGSLGAGTYLVRAGGQAQRLVVH